MGCTARRWSGSGRGTYNMSAAWVSLAENKHHRTREEHDSDEFESLISMTVAALANPHSGWKRSVARHTGRSLGNPVALVLWSVAMLHVIWPTSKRLIGPLARHMQPAVKVASPEHVSSALWSFGILHVEGDGYDGIVTELMHRSVNLAGELHAGQVSQICWGLARRERRSFPLCSRMAEQMLALAPGLSAKSAILHLTRIACAFAMLNFRSDVFMELVANKVGRLAAREHGSTLADWNLCAVYWAFDQLYPVPGQTSRFDGVWEGEGTIKGKRVIGEGGKFYSLRYNSDETVSLSLDSCGPEFVGKLVDSGARIEWTDGDIWRRGKQPFVEFQKEVHQAICNKGLEHRLKDVPLGPERWYTQYGTQRKSKAPRRSQKL